MKVEKLIIGNTYYIPHGTWNYKRGVLIRILDDKKKVLLEGKGENCFIVPSINCIQFHIKQLQDIRRGKELSSK